MQADATPDQMDVTEFFSGRSVLLTGVTGFVGQALLAKLLCACPGLERVYVLVRPKKGADPQQRLKNLLALPVFRDCRNADRVLAVGGDTSLPSLGLSPDDQDAVVRNVSVVVHSAATVKFDEPLRVAVQQNVCAVQFVIELLRRMTGLVSFVHVSTAYANCDRFEIGEEIYPVPISVKEMLRKIEEEDDDALKKATPGLLGKRPNTYSFTKALGENLLAEDAADLPVAIVRPSIVGWAWRDPHPGWVEGRNGVFYPFAGVSLGLLRSAHGHPDKVVDMVPVDMVVNTVLAVAWRTASHRVERPCVPPVYNCTSGASNPVRWGALLRLYQRTARERPSRDALWYPGCKFIRGRLAYELRTFLLQVIPSSIHDALAFLVGSDARIMPTQRRLKRVIHSISYFLLREWDFADGNFRQLWSFLSPRDRLIFPLDMTAVDWDSYTRSASEGTKQFLFGEEVGPEAPVRSVTGLYSMHIAAKFVVVTAFYLLLGWILKPVTSYFWPSRLIAFVHFLSSKVL